ncbi:GroES-like protein [Cylindrobasidium torrendii FP15055 ss-10]|uniref:GroES-like protein n=1 Tax=Cylindrobasidium torrendii FP15055 ss-10 TaxID=1314674 RepID=A0A0D7BPK8_9AGAR|nr:GroES-like protein [Cylindrobasidium torrendii FP15055 ss-10]
MSPPQLALLLEEPKGDFVVRQKEIQTPPPGEVLIKIHAAALNPGEWKVHRSGALIESYPAMLGTDTAGEVEAVGEGVTKFKKGDRVLGSGFFTLDRGAYQQYSLIPAVFLAKLPDTLSYDEGATLPMAFVTAAKGLLAAEPFGAGLNPSFEWPTTQHSGETALVIGGSTSVGQLVIQVLKLLGFTNIVAYASKKHHAFLTELGATQCVDRAAVSLDALADLIPSAHIVYDCVAADEGFAASKIVRSDGCAITVDIVSERSDAAKEVGKGKKFVAVFAVSFLPGGHGEVGEMLWPLFGKLLEQGLIKPNRFEILPGGLKAVAGGLDKLARDEVSGVKLVVHPQETVL